MTSRDELRLLPWSGPDGKLCFLSTDNENSLLSRLADSTEAIQLGLADSLVTHALDVLKHEEVGPNELRDLSTELTLALQGVIRVAESRGQRL
ncbi:hypothetical protein SNE510_05820 [Streptomyces sp. NE5-10]|uniref:hypothetical protein n=1 Tax=Streptomyces sp. NE5-10 TaxID=2759674 RepID=UPI001906C90D|nr:hypothetical protein [Streptomyces sp. NE5-10]GHJ91063.1 hypothetical protein SNE510_05820 [Streptomyces sp. NE5-10]